MEAMGVGTEHVVVGAQHSSSVSHILLDESGERAIIMAPASTGTIDAATARAHFAVAVQEASMLSTEISQVPLPGVLELLACASSSSVTTLLDVDVPPSVATTEAQLGR